MVSGRPDFTPVIRLSTISPTGTPRRRSGNRRSTSSRAAACAGTRTPTRPVPPVTAAAKAAGVAPGAVDHVVTQYQVAGGATVYAEGSWLLMQGFSMTYTVMFERATADFDLARGPEALRLDEEGKPTRVVKLKGPDGYGGEMRHIIQAIQTGKPPTIVTAEDGLSAVEICMAEEKSVKTGRVIAL